MAVGRDVMGADGLTNAQRYAKRLADKKARRAAWLKKQDAKKTTAAPSVSSPSSMFGSLLGTVKQATTPAPTATLGFGHQQAPAPIKTPPTPAPAPTATLGFGHQQTTTTPPPPKKTPSNTPDRAAAIAAQAQADAQRQAEAQRKAEALAAAQAAAQAAEAQRQAEAQAAAQAAAQDTLGFGHEQTTTTPPPPPVNNGMLTPLEQLAADGNTKAQQREQAATDFYGMSNAQREALQGYYDRGVIDPETNLISEEYLLDPENNDALYQMFTGGFGLGKNELHSSLMSQAKAGWTAQRQAANPYDAAANDGLTFGGGSDAGDYVETPPTYVDPPAPPPPPPAVVEPPPPQVDPEVRRQQEQDSRNKAFMDFLSKLGLNSLVDLFNGINVSSGGIAGPNASESTYTPYVPEAYTPSQVDYNSILTQANEVGYDPYRGLYNVPDAMKSTADQLGLFNYINPPQATPMAPYDPMANITVPTIDYSILAGKKKQEEQEEQGG